MKSAGPLLAGIELGGTKCVAILARGPEIIAAETVPTTSPSETLSLLDRQLQDWWARHRFEALGIASFGPIGLDTRKSDFGTITTTPKADWADTPITSRYAEQFQVPVGFDTDVNGAGFAEYLWGAAAGCDSHIYLTIGTGVGGGVIVNGKPVHGLVHPELGHLRLRKLPGDDFAGICPYHGDCLEGLVSGPAVAARAGAPAEILPNDHPVWVPVVHTLAELVAMLILTVSPQRVIIGGGMGSGKASLLPRVRAGAASLLNGYVAGITDETLADMICAPGLGDYAGPLGAIALARAAHAGAQLNAGSGSQ